MNDAVKKFESEMFSIGKSDLVKSFGFGLLAVLAVFAGQLMALYDPAIEAMKSGKIPVLPAPHDVEIAALIALGTGLGTLKLFMVHKFLSDADGTPRYIPFIGSISKVIGLTKQTVADGKEVVDDMAKKDMLAAMTASAKVAVDVQEVVEAVK